MKHLVIIPARYGSTRFPGKPLAMIGGKTMIERVYLQAKKSIADHVLVATDDSRIADVVRQFGGDVEMTDPHLPSGTDRCRAALETSGLSPENVVNIQGDEPFIAPEQINAVLALLNQPETDIATLVSPCISAEEVHSIHKVKVVVDCFGKALYFSRQAIPYLKSHPENHWHEVHTYFIHIGIYGFKTAVLKQVTRLNISGLEIAESLEQLRWLENGYRIHTAKTDLRTLAVDTPEDLKAIEKTYFS